MKFYELYRDGSMIRIKWMGSGQISSILSGSYTSESEAKQAVHAYEMKPKQRGGTRKIKKAVVKGFIKE